MTSMSSTALNEETVIRKTAHRLEGAPNDYDPLMQHIGDARIVLLGEATHGTQEFYRERAHITKRLITEKGFSAVAVEADWPDAYRVNRFVNGRTTDASANEALSSFTRFPTWMWCNKEVFSFITWLRAFNDDQPDSAMIGFYGLDLYSLHTSMQAVLNYLDKTDAQASLKARYRYACFDHFGEDPQRYGYAAGFGLSETCEKEVVAQLVDLHRHAEDYLRRDGFVAEDEYFFAEQNARLVKNAERYYRRMFHGRVESWNLRDQHMAETLEALISHLERHRRDAKIVLWEHNSHLGDARATDMGGAGEINVGQLVRERYGHQAVSVGFTTYSGSVTAASEWDGAAERKSVRPALPESYEAIFHKTGIPKFFLTWDHAEVRTSLTRRRLERAIGVIYLPETERLSHYFYAKLPEQFDSILHFDTTQAVHPLDPTPAWHGVELPETFPTGL